MVDGGDEDDDVRDYLSERDGSSSILNNHLTISANYYEQRTMCTCGTMTFRIALLIYAIFFALHMHTHEIELC